MFLADCHTHSSCSPDSSTPMVEMAKRAVEYGLTALTLTDHCDLLGLEGERTPDYDWAPVLEQRKETLAAFGTKLDLPMGVELGMAFLFPEAADQILSQPGIDFVIGAAHNLSEEAGGRDFYMLDYETPQDCYTALDDYFASMVKLAAGPHYDVVAHIIYPLRYMRHRPFPLPSLTRYRDQIHEIMRLAKDSGRGIEINTCARASLLMRRAPTNIILSEAGQAKMRKIEECLHCGQCAKKCPYGLDTPELLQRNYQDFQEVLAGKAL